MTQRMEAGDRKTQLLTAAIRLANENGWFKLTHVQVATATGTARSLVNAYFGNKAALKDAVMVEAVKNRNIAIVAEGLVYRNSVALAAPASLRKQAQAYIEQHDLKLPRWWHVDSDGQARRSWA
jgi:AcrR family transcriptional regulator